MLPEGGSEHDFRDPKIWRDGDRFYAVIGNRSSDGSGDILLYESRDAHSWQFVSVLSSCHNQYGRMWECPDFFPLDGKDVLLVSPQEMTAIGLEFHPGNANVCLIGRYDKKTHHLNRENVQAIDYGLDFYAPQTLLTEDGRRVMIGWMQNWETSSCKQQELRFMGQMTLPRELHVKDGRLYQNPVRELEQCRGVKIEYHNVLINGETSLRGISAMRTACSSGSVCMSRATAKTLPLSASGPRSALSRWTAPTAASPMISSTSANFRST